MYFEQAVARINRIDWDRVGTSGSMKDADLALVFLQRLAHFYQEMSIKPYPPLFSDIARLMGDTREAEFEQYYTHKTKQFLSETYRGKPIEYYLKLSQFAQEHPEARKYIKVYEPMIEILEGGGLFTLRHRGLEIEQIVYIPLYNWFDKFKKE